VYGRTLPQIAHALAVHDMHNPGCRACGLSDSDVRPLPTPADLRGLVADPAWGEGHRRVHRPCGGSCGLDVPGIHYHAVKP
jgi:hypothetical protein